MERYSPKTIDKLNRVSLNSDLKARMGLTEGSKIFLYPAGYLLVLQKLDVPNVPGYAVEVDIDKLGMFKIPETMLLNMGWGPGDVVVFRCVNEDMLLIELVE